MSITCRLWKAIKKYSLSPEVRDARSHEADWNPSCYFQLFNQILYYYYFFLQDAKSHHWKVRFLLLNVSFCAFAGFFYWKHNMYCESGSKCDMSSIFLLQSVSVVTVLNIHFILLQVIRFLPCLSISWSSPTWPSISQQCGTLRAVRSWSFRPLKIKNSD